MLQIPEKAIHCFETLTHSRITCYIHAAIFSLAIKPRIHYFPQCDAMKEISLDSCIQLDHVNLCRDARRYPDGGIKICHAGILEWFMPIIRENKLRCLLTAGLRRPPKILPEGIAVLEASHPCYKIDLKELSLTDSEEILRVQEALRMLAARLSLWYAEMQNTDFTESDMSRGDMIRCIIGRECVRGMTLKTLASRLHLSPDRTAHLVKEETGQSFTDLLMQNRLEYAANLLKNTERRVAGISEACGFGNVANFHRMFRREFGMTPLEFRKGKTEAIPLS